MSLFSRLRTLYGRAFLPFLAVLCLLRQAQAGDKEMARFLLDSGKKAVEKKQWDDAITKLQRARVEDASLIETGYWIAFAYDKKGTANEALKAYRAFRQDVRSALEGAP